MLSVANKPFKLSVMLNVVMLSVANKPFILSVMLNVIMLSVVAPSSPGLWTNKTWAEFSTPEGTICITNTA